MIDISSLQARFGVWLNENFSLRCSICKEKLIKTATRPENYICPSNKHTVIIPEEFYRRMLANQQRTGLIEELGELSHVDLKEEQCIREYTREKLLSEPDKAQHDRIDAIGDIIVYLLNYCNLYGISLEAAINDVGKKVLKRDWNKDSSAGGE